MKEEWEIKLIIDCYADQIYRLAYLYMHCDADANDIVQEVIMLFHKTSFMKSFSFVVCQHSTLFHILTKQANHFSISSSI